MLDKIENNTINARTSVRMNLISMIIAAASIMTTLAVPFLYVTGVASETKASTIKNAEQDLYMQRVQSTLDVLNERTARTDAAVQIILQRTNKQ